MTKPSMWFLSAVLCGSTLAAEFSGHVSMQLDGKTVAVTNALIRVVSPISPAAAERAKPVLKLNGNTLTPQVLVVLTNEEFTIENTGDGRYNLHLVFRQNPTVNLGVSSRNFSAQKRVEKPELFARVSEDLNQVHGHVCVVENPHYAVSGPKGSFSFTLSAGTYTIEAAHPRFGTLRKQVIIIDANERLDFTLTK